MVDDGRSQFQTKVIINKINPTTADDQGIYNHGGSGINVRDVSP